MKRTIRIIINIIFFVTIGLYLWYNYNAGQIFNKAIEYENNSNIKTASLAHEILIIKYRYTPISSISRIILFNKLNSSNYKSQMPFAPSLFFEKMPLLNGLNPIKVDFFSIFCLIISAILLFYILDLFSIRSRHVAISRKVVLIITFLIYLVTIIYFIKTPMNVNIFDFSIGIDEIWTYYLPMISILVLIGFLINLFRGERV